MSVRLYVGNLPEEVDRKALEDLFAASGEVVSTKVIRDRKTGKCRGFGFLTVETPELADQYIEKFNGYDFDGITLKIEVAQPRGKGEGEGDEAADDNAPQSTADKPDKEATGSVVVKKRSRTTPKVQTGTASGSAAATSTATQPDPRWASQLQRIKEQLLATNQS